jgi:phage-related protein
VVWSVTFFSDRVEAEILALPPGFVARFIRYAERMEIFGPDLGMPHTRAMGGGLFELRIKAAEGTARVFYCTVVDRRIVVLHQFVKKSDKTPPKELEIARRRMKEFK